MKKLIILTTCVLCVLPAFSESIGGNATPAKRPQNPQPPYPYHSEDVRFENKEAGVVLAGTFTWPKEGKNFPAVVLISGSGPQNRNEEVLGHSPFWVLSDYLTRNGIAVLRYDDRGVAESGGDYKTAGLDDFATDAAAALGYLKTRKEISPKKTGVIGHSEGGTLAFMLAGEKKNNPAFVVSMAGMAIPGDSLLRMQRYLIGTKSGASEEAIAQNEALVETINNLINRYPADSVLQNINRLADEVLPDSLKNNSVIRMAFQQGVRQMMSPELQSLMKCNPAGALAKTQCPVLALGGDKDLQVPAGINLNRIKTSVKGPVTVKEYSGLNHLFQHCSTGLIGEYGSIEETIAPEVLNDITVWIKQIVR
ncbi:MAG: alpha/beta hydrolase [Dysgonamonadaceae bacterium]|jgi:pimeloyl-ACP methyl ester carboxylesterase|nr:alpha/beta hydrolase [Dysgonamonadaceae bacterium]